MFFYYYYIISILYVPSRKRAVKLLEFNYQAINSVLGEPFDYM